VGLELALMLLSELGSIYSGHHPEQDYRSQFLQLAIKSVCHITTTALDYSAAELCRLETKATSIGSV